MPLLCDKSVVKLRDGVEMMNRRIVELLNMYNSTLILSLLHRRPKGLLRL